MRIEYFECECHEIEHMIRVTQDKWDGRNDIYIDYQLYPHSNVFKRIWIALKYIFKKEYESPWGDTLIKEEDIDRFIEVLNGGKN